VGVISVDIQPTEQRVVLTGRDDLVADDVVAALERAYGHPQLASGMNVLCDLRDARTDLTPRDIRRVVDFVSRHREARGGGKSAVVAGRDVDYGMARIAQVHLEPLGVELAVFRELQEAEEWLGAEVGT
jgi:hypothetical protein